MQWLIGTRVEKLPCKNAAHDCRAIKDGMVGTVRAIQPVGLQPGVEWDSWTHGHNLNGVIKSSRGRWMYDSCLKLLTPAESPYWADSEDFLDTGVQPWPSKTIHARPHGYMDDLPDTDFL